MSEEYRPLHVLKSGDVQHILGTGYVMAVNILMRFGSPVVTNGGKTMYCIAAQDLYDLRNDGSIDKFLRTYGGYPVNRVYMALVKRNENLRAWRERASESNTNV